MLMVMMIFMMKLERFAEWLDLYRFKLGSIAYMVAGMAATLEKLGNAEALEMAKVAEEKHRQARKAKYDWEQNKQSNPLKREGTQELDNRIDSTMTDLVKATEVLANLEADTEQSRLAREFLEDLFPAGVFPISSKEFSEQHDQVNELLTRLKNSHAEHVQKLNIEPLVAQLDELNTEFGNRLEPAPDGVSYDQVQSAYTEAEDAFHRLLIRVMNDYMGDMETLNRILEPVVEQTERTRRSLKNRGTIPEVDPETGEPIDSDNEEPTGETGTNSGNPETPQEELIPEEQA